MISSSSLHLKAIFDFHERDHNVKAIPNYKRVHASKVEVKHRSLAVVRSIQVVSTGYGCHHTCFRITTD